MDIYSQTYVAGPDKNISTVWMNYGPDSSVLDADETGTIRNVHEMHSGNHKYLNDTTTSTINIDQLFHKSQEPLYIPHSTSYTPRNGKGTRRNWLKIFGAICCVLILVMMFIFGAYFFYKMAYYMPQMGYEYPGLGFEHVEEPLGPGIYKTRRIIEGFSIG
uniref:Uncharacterized protein n=1 Tax=Acrobeloides nanus TaxID=290746 RepID=A0A914C3M9_9BILA